MTDPTIVQVTGDQVDPHWIEQARETQARLLGRYLPRRYADAVADNDAVQQWVRSLVSIALEEGRTVPRVLRGPSLLICGPTGTGKTHQAWGAIRALAATGLGVSWLAVSAADFYAQLRPRPGVDSETEFRKVSDVNVLVFDDLGAAKGTEWTEEVNYRLVNHRYEREMPTIFTSNVPPKDLGNELGDRVASRLTEMTTRVVLRGDDRRTAKGNVA